MDPSRPSQLCVACIVFLRYWLLDESLSENKRALIVSITGQLQCECNAGRFPFPIQSELHMLLEAANIARDGYIGLLRLQAAHPRLSVSNKYIHNS
jgi:hypothetical protein